MLDADGFIVGGPKNMVGKNVKTLGEYTDATPVPNEPAQKFGKYLEQQGGHYVKAAQAYYKKELQGHYVNTRMRDENGKLQPRQVFFGRIGNRGNDLTVWMENKKGKANFVPRLPGVIADGKYIGTEPAGHGRSDYSQFHVFEKVIWFDKKPYKVTVKVGEQKEGVLLFNFHYFLHKQANDVAMDAIQKNRLSPLLQRPIEIAKGFVGSEADQDNIEKKGSFVNQDVIEGVIIEPLQGNEADQAALDHFCRRLAELGMDVFGLRKEA